jgi:hypothetical protein
MIFFSLMLLAAYSFACLSVGLVLLRVFVGRESLHADHAPSARAASAFLLGGGVLANVWLGLSLLPGRWFTLPVVTSVVLLCAVVGAVPAAYALRDVIRQFILSLRTTFKDHWFWGVVAIATLAFPLLYALAASLPPRSDAVALYFSLPKLLAHEGFLRPLPGYEFFSQVGLHGELHVAALMRLGQPQAATLFAGFLGVPTAMMLIEIARRAGVGRPGRWCVFLLTYTSTAFVFLTFAGRLDLFGVAMGLAAIYWALSVPLRVGVLVMAGVLGCFSVIGKATYALTTVPMLVVLLLWRSWLSAQTGRRVRAVLRAGLWCLIGAIVAFVPHVVKNVVLYGPEFAFTPFINPPGNHDWVGSEISTKVDPMHILCSYPIAVFLGQFPGMYGEMTVAALALWPLALLLPKPKRFLDFMKSTLVQLTVVGVLGVAIFAALQTVNFSLRYFLPALLLLLLAPAAAADFVWNSPRVRGILKVGAAVVLVMALAERFNRPKGHPGEGLKYILGRVGELDVAEDSAAMCRAVNDHARPGDRVYLGTKYPYFLRPELIASAVGSSERLALADLPAPGKRWQDLYEKGFRFICVGEQGGTLHGKGRGFELKTRYGGLNSDFVPENLELLCRYWGPAQPHPNPYAVFELRSRRNEP